MHDGYRVGGVGLGATLVAEDPESQNRGADSTVFADQFVQHRAVRLQVVGVKLNRVDSDGPRRPHRRDLLAESVRAAGGQHHRRPRSKPGREFNAYLAAAAKNHDDATGRVGRVIHGCDYSLR